jgi:hypothetical protein
MPRPGDVGHRRLAGLITARDVGWLLLRHRAQSRPDATARIIAPSTWCGSEREPCVPMAARPPCQAAGRKLRQRAASWFDLVEAGLRGREGCDRLHYRRRPGRRLRARHHGRAQLVDREHRRSSACQRRSQRWRAACVARRPSCGRWASTLYSVAKAEPEAESSGCVQLAKIPSAPSAASGTMGSGRHKLRQRRLRRQRSTRFDGIDGNVLGWARVRHGRRRC